MMHNPETLEEDVQSRLEAIGGEALVGSGFEDEAPEAGFVAAGAIEEE
jgi:hypothetical protein